MLYSCYIHMLLINENFKNIFFTIIFSYFFFAATALVFDLGSGISKESVLNVCDTLENFFSLACTLGGPCRIPFISVMALNTFHEVS